MSLNLFPKDPKVVYHPMPAITFVQFKGLEHKVSPKSSTLFGSATTRKVNGSWSSQKRSLLRTGPKTLFH